MCSKLSKLNLKESMLPETQTPDFLSLTPNTKSDFVVVRKVWGRLLAMYKQFSSVDLENDSFSLGRAESNDVIITDDNMSLSRVTSISKFHFVITKEDHLVLITDLSKNGTFINGNLIGKGNKIVLQNDDEIAIGVRALTVYTFKMLGLCYDNTFLPQHIRGKYQVARLLGKGACAEVKLVYEKTTCMPYAIKRIIKANNPSAAKNLLNHPDKINLEVKILKALKHPFIISMKDIFDMTDSVFLVLDYMPGGELNNIIVCDHCLTEDECKFLFYQMSMAVQYLHSNSITHRDLKPENVLLKEAIPSTLLRITDFGLSKLVDEENYVMRTMCGTPSYAAPEVMDKSVITYTNKVDVWSMGVILYYMLSRKLPFRSKGFSEQMKKIKNAQFAMDSPVWNEISEDCKDLVIKMLQIDPNVRLNIKDVVKHPWIATDVKMKQRVDDLIYSNMVTECAVSDSEESEEDSSYSPATKRSRLSQSVEDD